MANILTSSKFLKEIQDIFFRIFQHLTKNSKFRKKIVEFPNFLGKFVVCLNNFKKSRTNPHIFKYCVFILFFLIREDKFYIPGETTENAKLRKFLLNKGLFLILFDCVVYSNNDKEIKNEIVLNDFGTEDYELQLSILKRKYGKQIDFLSIDKRLNDQIIQIKELELRKTRKLALHLEREKSPKTKSGDLDSSIVINDSIELEFPIDIKFKILFKNSVTKKFINFIVEILIKRYSNRISKLVQEEEIHKEVDNF